MIKTYEVDGITYDVGVWKESGTISVIIVDKLKKI